MSHYVVVTISKEQISKDIDDLLQLKSDIAMFEEMTWTESVQAKINDISSMIEANINHLREWRKSDSKIEESRYQSWISSTYKKIQNLKLYEMTKNLFFDYIGKDEKLVSDIIAQHGVIAIEAIKFLKQENIYINEEILIKKIDEFRQNELMENQLADYQKIFIEQIKSLNFPDESKLRLINHISKYKNVQEVSDILPFIDSKKREHDWMQVYVKDVVKMLKKINFAISGKPIIEIDENLVWKMKIKFKNDSNKTFQANFNSEGKISYKLGNYVGHACEKTTEKLLKMLNENGYTYSTPLIRRDIDSQPIYKAAKMKEK